MVVAGSLLAITVATEAGVRNVPPLYIARGADDGRARRDACTCA